VNAAEVVTRNPEVILASWCGKRVKTEEIGSRAGWREIRAVRDSHVYEIPSTCILQPGPASLTEGVRQIHQALAHVAGVEVAPKLRPVESIALL